MKGSLPLLQLCADHEVDESMSSSASISSFLTRGSANTSSLAAQVILEQIAEQEFERGLALSSVIATTSKKVFFT